MIKEKQENAKFIRETAMPLLFFFSLCQVAPRSSFLFPSLSLSLSLPLPWAWALKSPRRVRYVFIWGGEEEGDALPL